MSRLEFTLKRWHWTCQTVDCNALLTMAHFCWKLGNSFVYWQLFLLFPFLRGFVMRIGFFTRKTTKHAVKDVTFHTGFQRVTMVLSSFCEIKLQQKHYMTLCGQLLFGRRNKLFAWLSKKLQICIYLHICLAFPCTACDKGGAFCPLLSWRIRPGVCNTWVPAPQKLVAQTGELLCTLATFAEDTESRCGLWADLYKLFAE